MRVRLLWASFLHNVVVHPMCFLADVADEFVRGVQAWHDRTATVLEPIDWDVLELVDAAVELEMLDPLERGLCRDLQDLP